MTFSSLCMPRGRRHTAVGCMCAQHSSKVPTGSACVCSAHARHSNAYTAGPAASGRSSSGGSGSSIQPQAWTKWLEAPPRPATQQQHEQQQQRPALQDLLPGTSHTNIQLGNNSVDLYGNYSIQGPASIRKVNDALFAVVHPGGTISVLAADGPSGREAEMSQDGAAADATCNLLGRYVELCGAFRMQHSSGTMHDDKLVVNVGCLPEEATITLLPGGTLSHPVVVSPHPPPQQLQP